jgi:hypothetical protein
VSLTEIGLQKNVNKIDKKSIEKEAIIAEYLTGNFNYRKMGRKYGIDFRIVHS